MLFPAPLPDETFASLLARMARLNGYQDYRDLISTIFHTRRNTVASFIDSKINLSAFCIYTENAYGASEDVMRRLTNLYAQAHLGEWQSTELNNIAAGNQSLRLADLTFFGAAALSICQTCIDEDIARHGFSYWHRVHQLPFIHHCPIHKTPLWSFPCKRMQLHQSFPLPEDQRTKVTVQNSKPQSLSIHSLGIAAIALHLFEDHTSPFDSYSIREVFLDELSVRGVISPSRMLHIARFKAVFQEDNHPHLCSHSPRSIGNPKHLLRGIVDLQKCPALSRIHIVYWLFGGWAAFKEKCHWRATFDRPLNSNKTQTAYGNTRKKLRDPIEESIRRIEHRQKCIEYLTEYPSPTRLDFLKTHYKSFRWLLHSDRSWLDALLPPSSHEKNQLNLFSES